MKATMNTVTVALTAAGLLIATMGTSMATEIWKADNNEPLSSGDSWEDGIAPDQNNVAVWDGDLVSTTPLSFGLGADVAWQGMRLTNLVDNITVTNDGHTISLGEAGIVLDRNIGWKVLNVYAPLELTADQTWGAPPSMDRGGFHMYGNISGDKQLTLRNTYFIFYESVSFSALDIACVRLYLRNNANITGGILVSPGAQLSHMKSIDTDWADSFPGRVVTNNGRFYFGHPEGGVPRSAVTLNAGDRLITTGIDFTGRGEVTDNRLVIDGGELSLNWLYLKSGSITQHSGRVYCRYALTSGVGAPFTDKNRIVAIQGGTVDLQRLHIGDATSTAYPGVVEISGGSVTAARQGVAIADCGVALAAVRGQNADYFYDRSSDPAGILKVSGGSLRALQVSFGSTIRSRDASWNVTNGYARVELTGGDMTVGAGGVGPTEVWNRTAVEALPDTAQSWYDVILSGGTLGAYATHTISARMRLSDAHGGAVIRTADTNGIAYTISQTQPLIGSGGLRKSGAGTLALAAACTYIGATVVAEGTLQLVADELWEEEVLAEALPQPRVVWQADTLTAVAGQAVNTWSSTNNTWTFTLSGATSAWPWITPPTIGAEMNGHRTVAFNGVSSAMYLTGIKETPEEGATNLTVAVVMRAGGPGKGGNGSDWRNSSVIIGASTAANKWGIGYSSYGRAGAGITCRPSTVTTAWGAPRNLHDGQTHVLLYVWSGESNITMNVDGWRTSTYTEPGLLSDARIRSRMLIGATEAGNCFNGDIAEVHFYCTAFTPDQQRTLGLELARKYGADTAGYLTDEQLAVGSLASADVRIEAGATLQTASVGTRIRPGQVFRGAGTVSGNLIVGVDGIVQVATNEALNVETLTFEAGGVYGWPWTPEATPQAVETDDLTLPQGVVTVDLGATGDNPTPNGVLMRYTGTLTDNGADWNIVGGRISTVVQHDAVNKRFCLSTPTGTLIVIW